jgi:hypothetical protein
LLFLAEYCKRKYLVRVGRMILSDLEKQLLFDIYEMDMNKGGEPNFNNYKLQSIQNERFQEVAYYLDKLKRFGLIDYEESKAFVKGGRINPDYHNNVLVIWWKNIHITKEGIKYLRK